MPPSRVDIEQFERARQLAASGRAADAIEIFHRLGRKLGPDPSLACVYSSALLSLGRCEEARKILKKAFTAEPTNLDVAYHLADACRMCARIDEAHRYADRAIALAPTSPFSIGTKARLCLATGETQAAADLLTPMVHADPLHPSIALFYARLAPARVTTDEAITVIERALAIADLPDSVKSELLMRLGQLEEDAGRHDEAFAAYTQGNAIGPGFFNPAVFSHWVTQTINAWTPQTIEAGATSRLTTDRPVFIVGMPRSGTTLIERILASHPSVRAGGEKSDVINFVTHAMAGSIPRGSPPLLSTPQSLAGPDLDKAAIGWMDTFGRLPKPITRVTDKMPLNGLHLGVIKAMFPGARVIWCRRDRRDTCLSCFANWFDGYHAFSRDLPHADAFHRDFDRLMNHWRSVLDLPMLEVWYEDVVADLASQARRTIDFLDLAWDEACAAPHKAGGAVLTNSVDQVRRPIYSSSVGRWKRFEAQVVPVVGEQRRHRDTTTP
jgi:tetratricopeptide (TPR) repeat protein